MNVKMFGEICDAFGPSGFEEDVIRTVAKYCKGLELENDAMNNLYARMPGEDPEKPVVMLDAHTDECGFMVQGIMENGLLSLIMLGGMDLPSIPAHTLLVRTRAGKLVEGIITSRPVHFMTDKEKSAIELYFGLNADSAAEYNALKVQYPDALVGFEQNGQFEFYGEDARKICELTGGKLLERETALGTVLVTGFPREQWVYRAKQLWECGENIYLAGLNEDGTHHQTKYLRREEYLPVGSIVHMEGREFRVDKVDFDKDSVALQDMALADLRMPIFREAPLAVVRELYEQEPEPPVLVSDGLGLPGEDSNKLPVSIEVNEVPTTPEAAAAEEGLNEEGAPELAGNFRITDEELGAGGPKQKFARNIKAIKTLFTLEQGHRGATAEEQQVLSQYVGWGGLADAFDPDKNSWAKEYAELKGLLSEEEYKAARGSVLNAHYTSPTIIRAIYDAVERMGFRTVTFWNRPWALATSSGCCPRAWQTAACTVWNWTVSRAGLPKSCTRRPTSKWPDLKPRIGGISTI